jgi:hypothetical protein
MRNYKSILLNNYKKKINPKGVGKTHKIKHLPKNVKTWDQNISLYLKRHLI